MLCELGSLAAGHARGEEGHRRHDSHRLCVTRQADIRKDPRALDLLLGGGALGEGAEAHGDETRAQAALDAGLQGAFVLDRNGPTDKLERSDASGARGSSDGGKRCVNLFGWGVACFLCVVSEVDRSGRRTRRCIYSVCKRDTAMSLVTFCALPGRPDSYSLCGSSSHALGASASKRAIGVSSVSVESRKFYHATHSNLGGIFDAGLKLCSLCNEACLHI